MEKWGTQGLQGLRAVCVTVSVALSGVEEPAADSGAWDALHRGGATTGKERVVRSH